MRDRLCSPLPLIIIALLGPLVAGCHRQAWSPDGKMIALDVGGELWLFDVAARRSHAVNTGGGYVVSPTYSPDGKHLAYFAITGSTKDPDRVELRVRDLASGAERVAEPDDVSRTVMRDAWAGGGEARQLARFLRMLVPIAWSPDSRHLAATKIVRRYGDLQILDAMGVQRPIPIENPVHWGMGFPAWSPDGTRLAYLRIDPKTLGPFPSGPPAAGLWTVAADGSQPVRRWEETEAERLWRFRAPVWSPEGRDLLILTERADGTPAAGGASADPFTYVVDAQLVSASGGAPRLLARDVGAIGSVSPNLRSMVYMLGPSADAVMWRTAPLAESKALLDLRGRLRAQLVLAPTMSPDGKTVAVAWEDFDGGHPELVLCDVATAERTIVPVPASAMPTASATHPSADSPQRR